MTIIERLIGFFIGRDGYKSAAAHNSISDTPKEKNGRSHGEFVFEGVEDDESIAAILAAVSEYTEIPMDELKITAVRAIR